MKKISLILFITIIGFSMNFINLNALEIPTATFKNIQTSQTSITLEYTLEDIEDDIIMHTQEYYPEVVLYQNDIVVDSILAEETTSGSIEVVFDNLEANSNYVVAINAPYDLLGEGIPTNEKPYEIYSQTISTDKIFATGNIHLITDPIASESGYSKLDIYYDLLDEQDTLIINDGVRPELSLYKDGQLIEKIAILKGGDQFYSFESLESNTLYTVEITGPCDVNGDGQPDNENDYILASSDFTTQSLKKLPTALIHEETGENPTVVLDESI